MEDTDNYWLDHLSCVGELVHRVSGLHIHIYLYNNVIIVSFVQYCCHNQIIIVFCIMLSSLLRWWRTQQITLNSRIIIILFIKNILPSKLWGGLISRIRLLSLRNRRTISTTWSTTWGCCWRGCKFQFWSWLTTLQDFGSSGWSPGGKTLKSCSTPQGLLPRRPLWSWSINAN